MERNIAEVVLQHGNWALGKGGARADLSGENLSWAGPHRLRLRMAILSEANLRGCDLRNSDLWGIDLMEADLRGCDFRGSDLTAADFWGADMRESDLRDCDLTGARFCRADLRGAKLPPVPTIPDIHRAVYAAASQPGALHMKQWHCGAAHCRAGWIITLAGEPGAALERQFGTGAAAALIYAASDPELRRVPEWDYCDARVLSDMKRLATKSERAGKRHTAK